MVTRTIDLSGTYVIAALSATEITFASPEEVNPNWYYADLDGVGTTGYAHNISMIVPPVTQEIDLAGAYVVATVSPTQITLTSPEDVNPDWNTVGMFPGLKTRLLSSFVSTTNAGNWIGPFIVEPADTTLLVANFVAAQGLYKDNGKKQTAFPVTIQIEATPVDSADTPIGPPQTFSTTIPGNPSGRDSRAVTLVCELANPGRQSVRARRSTDADYNFKGSIADEVKWKDLYGVSPVDLSHFGNVTTVHSRTYATEGALNVKERKLNMLVTRLVPNRIAGTSFTAPAATTNAADIFTALCLDPYIGGRALAELDLDAIYGAVAEAVSYFGIADAGRFSYTFDDDNTSFEESGSIIASAVFCSAFRQASLIRLALERATENSEILFNHRNKLPASETRTARFGNLDGNDGVEVEYIDPSDDSSVTLYLPSDRSATKPRQIKALGARSRIQAYWTAWRAYNKIRFQNMGVEFTALQEAAVVARNSRVLIADNTRPETQDGELISQAGLQLETSQPVTFAGGVGYTMFIQLPDGTVDSMPVVAGSNDHHVVIGRAPRVALIFGNDQYALPTYQIVRNDSPRPDAFLISEREPASNFTFTVRAINYSPLYYANDQLAVLIDFESGYQDAGPFQRDAALVGGGSAIVTDATRGKVHHGTGQQIALPAFNAPASYTKAVWVKGGFGAVLSTPIGAGYERFHFEAGQINVSHSSGGGVNAAWPDDGTWHHAAVTFDAATGEVVVYVDGETAAVGAAVQRTLAPIYASGFVGAYGFVGSLDNIRLMTRAFSPAEVRAIYRSTRL